MERLPQTLHTYIQPFYFIFSLPPPPKRETQTRGQRLNGYVATSPFGPAQNWSIINSSVPNSLQGTFAFCFSWLLRQWKLLLNTLDETRKEALAVGGGVLATGTEQ